MLELPVATCSCGWSGSLAENSTMLAICPNCGGFFEESLIFRIDSVSERLGVSRSQFVASLQRNEWLDHSGFDPMPTDKGKAKGLRRYGFLDSTALFDLYMTKDLYHKFESKFQSISTSE